MNKTAAEFTMIFKDPSSSEATLERINEDQIPFIHTDALLDVCSNVDRLERRCEKLTKQIAGYEMKKNSKATAQVQMAKKSKTVSKKSPSGGGKKAPKRAPKRATGGRTSAVRASAPREQRAHH